MFTGIITAVASAILGVFWGMMNIRYARQEAREDEEQRFNAYGNYLIRIADRLKQEYEQNEKAMHTMYPAAGSCCQYGEGSASLWNDDPPFHCTRIQVRPPSAHTARSRHG